MRYLPVNLEALNRFDDGARVDEAVLRSAGWRMATAQASRSSARRTDAEAYGERPRIQRGGAGQD